MQLIPSYTTLLECQLQLFVLPGELEVDLDIGCGLYVITGYRHRCVEC